MGDPPQRTISRQESVRVLKTALLHPRPFVHNLSRLTMRSYQREVLTAILESILQRRGLSFVVMFPRQSGKNELQAQIECFLLCLYSQENAEMVKVSPTWKPQSLNAMRRLERVLEHNPLSCGMWRKESGYIYRLEKARMLFFSGSPEAHIVGATASTLLEVDEAQDISLAKYDRDIAPMAASTNATRVFWGTAWTSQTLLARELRACQAAEKQDGMRRTFTLSGRSVGVEVPEYQAFMAEQVARLGAEHPMVRTQYFSEEIDSGGGLFGPARLLLMRGTHPALVTPAAAETYVFLLDIAGQDENSPAPGEQKLANPRRDSTALTIVRLNLKTGALAGIQTPVYEVVGRFLWTGAAHTQQYEVLHSLADTWRPRWLVVDATGIGAGLAGFLEKAFPGRVLPFTFTQASKSELGWKFLSIIEGGRWREHASGTGGGSASALQAEFFHQLGRVTYEVLPGVGKTLRWSVPDGTRDPLTGAWVHDDLVISAALSGVLEGMEWKAAGPTLIVPRKDVLEELDHGF